MEIIIVNDGSTDLTADYEYAAKYLDIVRVFHQENGVHGAAINTGLQNANGVFIKVVDSDDWVDWDSYGQIINTLKQFTKADRPDMVLSNFVYEKEGKKHKTVMRYANVLPEGTIFTWDDIG